MDKVLELSLRSIVSLLNNDVDKAEEYKNIAIELNNKKVEEDKYIIKIEDYLSRRTKIKLYELVG